MFMGIRALKHISGPVIKNRKKCKYQKIKGVGICIIRMKKSWKQTRVVRREQENEYK